MNGVTADYNPSWWRRALWYGDHYVWVIDVVLLVVVFVSRSIPSWDESVFVMVPLWLVLGFVVIAQVQHMRTMDCSICVKEIPLDPQRAVNKNRLFLRVSHSMKVLIGILVLLCIAEAIVSNLVTNPSPITRWTGLAIWAFLVFNGYAINQHRRLSPWCPYCQGWDEGGDHEQVPDPDLSMTKELT